MRIVLALAAACVFADCANAQTQSAPPPPTPPLANCSAAVHHALDFWIGEWDAYRGGDNHLSGRSSITASDSGCVINEHWTSLNAPYSGRSLNIYDTDSGHWEQFWADSTGSRIHFIGGAIAGGGVQMSTTGPTGANPAQWQRVTFTPNADGSLTQQGDTSADGQTWTLGYRFIYRHHQGN